MGLVVERDGVDALVERGMLMRAYKYISMKYDSHFFDAACAVPSMRMIPLLSTNSTNCTVEAMLLAKIVKWKGNNEIRKRAVGDKSRTGRINTNSQRFCNFPSDTVYALCVLYLYLWCYIHIAVSSTESVKYKQQILRPHTMHMHSFIFPPLAQQQISKPSHPPCMHTSHLR